MTVPDPLRVVVVVVMALSSCSRKTQSASLDSPSTAPSVGVGRESDGQSAPAPDVTFARRCASPPVSIETIGSEYRFCADLLELTATVPILITRINVPCDELCEIEEYELSVGGTFVKVRRDVEWSNLIAAGWHESEILKIVYPQAVGRVAERRLRTGIVRKEYDLMFTHASGWRVHVAFEAPSSQLDVLDAMVRSAYCPMVMNEAGRHRAR